MSQDNEDKSEVNKAVEKERLRLATKILSKSAGMASDYKNTIKHTGGLLTQSMTFAYAKGLQDAFKLLSEKE